MNETSRLTSPSRYTILCVLVAVLVATAGCSSLVSESTTPTETPSTPSNTLADEGSDLRSISVPENGSSFADGEVDGSDPLLASTGTHYEPIQFTVDAGTMVNLSVVSESGTPELRLQDPNGTTVASDSSDGNSAEFATLELNQTGQYTLVVTSSEEYSGFEYTLTVERYIEPNFNGPPSSWDEESRYLEFGYDYAIAAENTSAQNLTAINRTANPEENYIVLTYKMEPNATTHERLSIDSALQITYWYLYESYTERSNNIHNQSWVPERIYHRAITPDGDFYRSTYVTLEWARDYGETEDPRLYGARYFATLRYGPANQGYIEGGNRSTTASDFPEETYRNVTVNVTTRQQSS